MRGRPPSFNKRVKASPSQITVTANDKTVNAKSMLGGILEEHAGDTRTGRRPENHSLG